LNIEGPALATLVREALEAEYGGEIGTLLDGLKPQTLEDPEKFAAELFKTFGSETMQYYVTIIKYAESGRFQPEQAMEQEKEDERFEPLVRETEPDSDREAGTDPQT
jgi:hypothetical protein